jgi:RNA polymerase sigma-70 factor (ECF subfamily)
MTRSSIRPAPSGAPLPESGGQAIDDAGRPNDAPSVPARVLDPPDTRSVPVSEQLWHDVHDRLTAFVAQRVDDPADVADLVQTVFLRVHQHIASVADEQRLLPWLFQITRNAIADYYRAPVRRREIGGDVADGALDLPDEDRIVSEFPAPDEVAPLQLSGSFSASDEEPALRDLAGCVRPLVQLLPLPYREALTLVEFDGVPQVEVASQLGISVSGMKSRVQRGRLMLRDGLVACCDISRSATGGVLDFAPRSGGSCGAAGSGASPATPCQQAVPLARGTSRRCTPGE